MNRQLTRDIKRIFRTTKENSCYRTIFERKLVRYIQKRAPENSVNWEKLDYELYSIYHICRDSGKPLKVYLSVIARLTHIALEGRHKQVELDLKSLAIK